MSRIPRYQEHLKTGFTAEAVSAARCRAYAARADQDGRPNLALHWQRLAAEKDTLAVKLLEAAEQVRPDPHPHRKGEGRCHPETGTPPCSRQGLEWAS